MVFIRPPNTFGQRFLNLKESFPPSPVSSSNFVMEYSESSVIEAVDHHTSAEVDGENVILDLDQGVYYGLNPVGTLVWQHIQEPISIGEIVTEITAEYEVDHERCFDDVVSLLQDLEENGLIVVKQR